MLLYHLSTDLEFDGDFSPRIPSLRRENEDATFERVCVSNTIEGCLSAIPYGGSHLEVLQERTLGFYQVFVIDTKECGIPDSAIIKPEELYKSSLVEDAPLTGEHWITVPFFCSSRNIIYLSDWDEEAEDIYPYEVERLILEKNMDIFDAFEQVCPERNGLESFTVIQRPLYYEESIPEGESFHLAGLDFQLEEDVLNAMKGVLEASSHGQCKALRTIQLTEFLHSMRDLYES